MLQSSRYKQEIQHLRDFLAETTQKVTLIEKPTKSMFKNRQTTTKMYTLVFNMCNQKPSLQQKLFQQYKEALKFFLHFYSKSMKQKENFRFSEQNSWKVLMWFNDFWNRYTIFMVFITKQIFAYLDRYYLPGLEDCSLYKAGLKIFFEFVYNDQQIFSQVYFIQLEKMRACRKIDNYELLKFSEAIAVMDSSNNTINQVSSDYVIKSKEFYEKTYAQIQDLPCMQYFHRVYNLSRFQKALSSMTMCLRISEQIARLSFFELIFIKQYTPKFIQKSDGFSRMFQTNNFPYMKLVHSVYTEFQKFDNIRQAYYNYVIKQGQFVLKDKKGIALVEQTYGFFKYHQMLLSEGFKKQNEMLVSLNNSIEKLVSKQENFIRHFYELCKSIRLKDNFQKEQEKVTTLFEKLSSKDQFISLYEQDLLDMIFSGEINIKKEESFINYLNQMCGSELTSKLIKKLKDFSEAPPQELFKAQLPKSINFHMSIINLQLWEKRFIDQTSLNLNLPQLLERYWKKIEHNYVQIDNKKKLILLPFCNILTLHFRFNKVTIPIKCNLMQASILLFISNRQYCSEQDIICELMIEKSLMQNTLETILEVVPDLLTKTVMNDYMMNWSFSGKDNGSTEIDLVAKLPKSSLTITKAIKQDRQILVEAAMVKFIKRAKQATFQELVNGIISAIKLFRPQPVAIKATLDKLIKKGYIEEGEANTLLYVD